MALVFLSGVKSGFIVSQNTNCGSLAELPPQINLWGIKHKPDTWLLKVSGVRHRGRQRLSF